MAAFTTMALIGLAAASAYTQYKTANGGKSAPGQTGAELLSGKGPTDSELAAVNAQRPTSTVLGAGGPGVPKPPDAGLAEYNAMSAGRMAATKQRTRAAGQSSILGGGAPSAFTATAGYAPRTLLGS